MTLDPIEAGELEPWSRREIVVPPASRPLAYSRAVQLGHASYQWAPDSGARPLRAYAHPTLQRRVGNVALLVRLVVLISVAAPVCAVSWLIFGWLT